MHAQPESQCLLSLTQVLAERKRVWTVEVKKAVREQGKFCQVDLKGRDLGLDYKVVVKNKGVLFTLSLFILVVDPI